MRCSGPFFTWHSGCCSSESRREESSFAVNIQAGSLGYARDDGELENGKRAINSRQHFLFSKNLEQMIQTRSHVAASHSETSGMDNRANFDAELCCCAF